jgi:hypothetical protein
MAAVNSFWTIRIGESGSVLGDHFALGRGIVSRFIREQVIEKSWIKKKRVVQAEIEEESQSSYNHKTA